MKPVWPRKIIHVDMDAFFAAIEQRDFPEYRGRPVVVGGNPQGRGVVSTCSYEARRFGIHSAMPAAQARRLCPDAVFLRPRFEVYREVSRSVMAILNQHTELVESLSLDEAYLDVTAHRLRIEDPVMAAKLIKQNIVAATGLTASAGVAVNMFLAKVASDFNKPDGLTVVEPGREAEFLEPLAVRKIPGVGPVTEENLHAMGIRTCGELALTSERKLLKALGQSGLWLRNCARGRDDREVEPWTEARQASVEHTFERDLLNLDQMEACLEEFAQEVFADLRERQRMGRTVVLKVKYHDFELITRSLTLDHEPSGWKEILEVGCRLLRSRTRAGRKPVRLLGLGISGLEPVGELRSRFTPDLFSRVEET